MLGRALYELAQDCEYKIVSIEGGKKDNAIPREAHAVLAVKNGDVAAASAKESTSGDLPQRILSYRCRDYSDDRSGITGHNM